MIRFNAALRKGDIDEALSRMQSFLAGMPNDLENKTDKHYQTIIYLISPCWATIFAQKRNQRSDVRMPCAGHRIQYMSSNSRLTALRKQP